MRRPELDHVLNTMLDAQPEVSDLLFTVGRPLQVESFGELKQVVCDPPIGNLTPFQTEMVALNLIGDNLWHINDLLRRGSCDTAYTLADRSRFRISIFSQRGNYSIVLRKLNTVIPTLASLNFPEVFKLIPREKTGLVLVTGATGSGKSTTLAAILNEINNTKPVHIITLEDPVEFIHSHNQATFNQRELGSDFDSFSNGLRAALRQAPKVILVGEMRDRETVKIVLSAAETGHLVLSTLHTVDAGQTINRILGMFEPDEQEQIRVRLADTIRWIISQRLVSKIGGGRLAHQTECAICNGAATDRVCHLQWSCNRQSVPFAMELQQTECVICNRAASDRVRHLQWSCNRQRVTFAMEDQQTVCDIWNGAATDRVCHLQWSCIRQSVTFAMELQQT